MWSKGAKNDYLDSYDYEEEYDDYEEIKEEPKTEVKEVEKPLEQIEVKMEINVVISENIISKSEYDSDYEEDMVNNYRIKKDLNSKNQNRYNNDEMYIDELLFNDYDFYNVNNNELYKKYKQYNSISNIIKRFGFKKLKSNDKNTYYLDKTLYFIWKYVNDPKTNEEQLVRVDDVVYNKLRSLNTGSIIYDRYLAQPEVYY